MLMRLSDMLNNSSGRPDNVADALGISQDDMLFNQTGRISDRQKNFLRRERVKIGLTTALPLMFIVLVIGYFNFFVFFAIDGLAIVEIIFNLIIIAFLAYGAFRLYRVNQDIADGSIVFADGHIRRHIQGSRNSRTHYIIVDGVKLQVSRKIYTVFINGDAYRVYYSPRSKVLLNATHHPSQKAKRE